jgi:hypothetical protein
MSKGPSQLLRSIAPAVVASVDHEGGNDGYLTAEQYEDILDAIASAGKAFQYTVGIGDNDDFTVTIPVAKRPATADYVATMTIQSGSIFTLARIPYANQTTSTFRVITDGLFAVGTLLAFTITEF